LPETGRSLLQDSLFAWLEPTSVPGPDTRPAPIPEPAPTPEQKTTPPAVTTLDVKAPDLSHIWVVAAEIEVTAKIASVADYRGSFKSPEGQRVDALEVYCRGCRRPYDEVRGADCAAKIDNTHLIGGDQSKRAKRKVPTPPANARIISGGTINRRGISAYVSGVSRPKR
jgi:hypothetical protein